jgi:RimJ/RimL family protein N-acetyltransferase
MSRVLLRAVVPQDELRRLVWQSDDELRRLAPSVGRTFNYEEYAIEVAGTHIGFCSVSNVTQNEAELGILIGSKDYWGKGYGTDVVKQLTAFCFNSLGVKRVYLKVLHSNIRALKCYERCWFIRYGNLALDGYSFILMEKKAL